ncbi:hypothetical protein IJ118_01010 [Candidatus Saccharibacteria bacterium]|nr:hypothetical protein [Candidatus Saccharibacteria bacterium]
MPKPDSTTMGGPTPLPAPTPLTFGAEAGSPAEKTIEEMKKLIESMEKSSGAVITPEIIEDFGVVTAAVTAAAEKMQAFYARIRAAAGSKTPVVRPVFVFRYVDRDEKEGFIPADEENAELKARTRDADGKIEFGYAYPKDGKFVGFTATKTIDGADGGRV